MLSALSTPPYVNFLGDCTVPCMSNCQRNFKNNCLLLLGVTTSPGQLVYRIIVGTSRTVRSEHPASNAISELSLWWSFGEFWFRVSVNKEFTLPLLFTDLDHLEYRWKPHLLCLQFDVKLLIMAGHSYIIVSSNCINRPCVFSFLHISVIDLETCWQWGDLLASAIEPRPLTRRDNPLWTPQVIFASQHRKFLALPCGPGKMVFLTYRRMRNILNFHSRELSMFHQQCWTRMLTWISNPTRPRPIQVHRRWLGKLWPKGFNL